MLQDGSVLLTWALDELPQVDRQVSAEQLNDHRLMYLDFEGDIGSGRGYVTRWDRGSLDWLERGPDRWIADLNGERLRVRVELSRPPHGQRWLLAVSSVPSANRD
jgi:hypothetical protein